MGGLLLCLHLCAASVLQAWKERNKNDREGVTERVYPLTLSRKAKLDHLARRAIEIKQLMEDDANVNTVKQKLSLEFQDSLKEWCKTNGALTSLLSEDEQEKDQRSWSEPKLMHNCEFMQHVETWIKAAEDRAKQAKELDGNIQPGDSVYR